MNTVSMCSLNEGCCGTVTAMNSRGSMRRRLMDMGLIEGTKVICLHKSACGDPIAYLIRGAVIALRNEDSSQILVSVI
ncbi:MAG: ferrous iron transport protein A [Huintestinicola sp.]